MKKENAINNAKIKINAIEKYVRQYTVNLEEFNKLMSKIVKKTPTDLQYPERYVFMKKVKTQTFWTFELGIQNINVPIWIFVVFQQSDRQQDQNLNKDNFYRMPVTSAQVVIGTEKRPDSGLLINYKDDEYNQGYGQPKEAFKSLTKENILQAYLSEDDFRSSNDGDKIGYNIHSSDIRYQNFLESGQSVKIVPAGIYGYALILTNRLVSICSDGQRMFDLTQIKFFHNTIIFFHCYLCFFPVKLHYIFLVNCQDDNSE